MAQLSSKVRMALSSLSAASREAQRNGNVSGARKLMDCARDLETELQMYADGNAKLERQLAEAKVLGEKLQTELDGYKEDADQGWPVPAEIQPLPADYWESAE